MLIGSYLSSRAPDKFIRPIITFVIFASGLKYVGVGTTALGWILVIVALGGMGTWLFLARPWSNSESKQAATATATAGAANSNGHAAVTVNGSKSIKSTESINGTESPADAEAETAAHSADPDATAAQGPGS